MQPMPAASGWVRARSESADPSRPLLTNSRRSEPHSRAPQTPLTSADRTPGRLGKPGFMALPGMNLRDREGLVAARLHQEAQCVTRDAPDKHPRSLALEA
jgi:hypothetical protein